MKISKNWLQKYFEKPLPSAKELEEFFTFHAFEVESVEDFQDGEYKDQIMDLKVLPDRAHYALCHKGIAEEIHAITGQEMFGNKNFEYTPNDIKAPEINIETKDFCLRYMAVPIKLSNMPKDSPLWLKNSLNSIGQRSISPIVDLANYVMFDVGQPLHTFDADKLSGGITVRKAKNDEKITLLDGREITMSEKDHVIADDKDPLVVAGAKGGSKAEIDQNTKTIIVESANFHPSTVRKTANKYDIRSDASKRFENELSPYLAEYGIREMIRLIKVLDPQCEVGKIVDVFPNKPQLSTIKFNPNYVEERLGIQIKHEDIFGILIRLGFKIDQSSSDWLISVPYNRLDITDKNDLVEEIGRIYGYDKIAGTLLPPKTDTKILPIFYITELIKTTLVNAGFSEVNLYSLVDKGHFEMQKPLAKDKAFAREELSRGMLDCVQKNTLNADLLGLDSIKIFEIGHIFTKESERTHLIIGANQIKKIKGYKSDNIVNEAIASIQKALNLQVETKISKDKTGNITVAEIDLDQLVSLYKGDFDISRLDIKKSNQNRFKKFSIYPFIVRDIAVLVPNTVENNQVWSKILETISNNGSLDLLVRHSLFDTYKKDNSTSYAWRMVFQASDRTLTDEETNGLMERVYKVINENNWLVR